jgi:predicted outer membrane lipoprotein
MFIALVISAILLAAMCVSSASMKLRRNERAVAITGGTVGVPLRLFPVLASLELAGAAGILTGLWLELVGIAAAAGLVAYFIGAVTGHLRAGDTKNLTMPLVPLTLSIAVLVLRLVTA